MGAEGEGAGPQGILGDSHVLSMLSVVLDFIFIDIYSLLYSFVPGSHLKIVMLLLALFLRYLPSPLFFCSLFFLRASVPSVNFSIWKCNGYVKGKTVLKALLLIQILSLTQHLMPILESSHLWRIYTPTFPKVNSQ